MREEKKKSLTKKELNERKHRRWVIFVTIGTFCSTLLVTWISDALLANTTLLLSFVILITIILFGIVADVVGVAMTAVNIDPFNAMAARKIRGAKTAVKFVKNAAKVSNLCNDVIGDICGVVSGATSVSIAAQLLQAYPVIDAAVLSLVMSGCVACLTVGGKALGKQFAINNGTNIVHKFSVAVAFVKGIFGIRE